jgi:NAD(P)-dependent dehydrogenase (short-subunit alcohol dehydrogenase family)
VAVVTGGAGGIGKAIAEKLAREGACVVLSDNRPDALDEAKGKLEKAVGKDTFAAAPADVLQAAQVEALAEQACLAFGGLDIVVNCAGLSISRPWKKPPKPNTTSCRTCWPRGSSWLPRRRGRDAPPGPGRRRGEHREQERLFAGPNNIAYGTAKAAQLHMSRLMAAELGKDKIRVNVVNPDAVIEDSFIWKGGWAEGRAKAYGITVEELPAFYAKRTLLNEVILPEDIANGVFAFVGGLFNKSTGNTLNVDGGVAAAFVR